ncbi:zinc-ribbon domain containing protein [Roseburia sp. 1XD42-69]|uniref:zinc-ribbon domain containing protein n=1 Tax=Roseburia sp. 1XD42-69 TaxID=2320088 RepID=UPI000EA20291|nr:zinc-ribbon domain containing protein [Roseburia sp. 1XD42-69]RKJ68822.1 hypothetical protein D7Y06_00800 [Roseburia sp. 1XD42-69]
MIIAIGKYIGSVGEFYHEIPAYVENGILVLGHNGSSLEYGGCLDSPDKYAVEDFEYFANHTYRGRSFSTPHYLYKGKIPYEIMGVYSSSKCLLYTYLIPCRDETYFCKCKDCGKNFVLDCYEIPFFKGNGLTVPTVRCKSCISKKKDKNK